MKTFDRTRICAGSHYHYSPRFQVACHYKDGIIIVHSDREIDDIVEDILKQGRIWLYVPPYTMENLYSRGNLDSDLYINWKMIKISKRTAFMLSVLFYAPFMNLTVFRQLLRAVIFIASSLKGNNRAIEAPVTNEEVFAGLIFHWTSCSGAFKTDLWKTLFTLFLQIVFASVVFIQMNWPICEIGHDFSLALPFFLLPKGIKNLIASISDSRNVSRFLILCTIFLWPSILLIKAYVDGETKNSCLCNKCTTTFLAIVNGTLKEQTKTIDRSWKLMIIAIGLLLINISSFVFPVNFKEMSELRNLDWSRINLRTMDEFDTLISKREEKISERNQNDSVNHLVDKNEASELK